MILPSFDLSSTQIKNSILDAIELNRADFNKLTTNQSNNTNIEEVIAALENLDMRLGLACAPIQHLLNVKPTQEIAEGYFSVFLELSQYGLEIAQNKWLHEFINYYLKQDLNFAHHRILSQYHEMFVLSGSGLDANQKIEYAKLQDNINVYTELFDQNVQNSVNKINSSNIIVDDNQLQKILNEETKKNIRKEAYDIFYHRASSVIIDNSSCDNELPIKNILNTRLKLANLLGYPSYINMSLSTKSMDSSDAIIEFLENIERKCIPKCKILINDINNYYSLEHEIMPWDINYYFYRYNQKNSNLNIQEISDYYELNNVIEGLSRLTEEVFGIRIERIKNVKVWHDDVSVFEIKEDDKTLGYVYADFFGRENKKGKAWVDTLQSRRKLSEKNYQKPIVLLTCNFPSPTNDTPCLLSQDNLVTLFHEWGHLMHHMLYEGDYASLAGTNGVAIDEVEIPSMFFEKFAWEKQVINLFAKHYKTHEPMPDELFDKLKQAQTWIAPIKLVERLKTALFDFEVHAISSDVSVEEIEEISKKIITRTNFLSHPYFDEWYKSSSLVFTSPYAGGYYSYLWAEMLASDLFSEFSKKGVLNRESGQRFRKHFLAPGGLFKLDSAFQAFCGRKPSQRAFYLYRHIQEDTHD